MIEDNMAKPLSLQSVSRVCLFTFQFVIFGIEENVVT